MSVMSDVLSRKITKLTKAQLQWLTSIRQYAFHSCTLLREVDLPDSMVSINSSSFQDCTALKRVSIPSSVTAIGGSAFYNCTSLTTVTWSEENLESIAGVAFTGCTALKHISLENVNPYIKIAYNAFGTDTGNIRKNLDIVTSKPENSMICVSNGRVLFYHKIVDPSTGFVIPETVINLVGGSCSPYQKSLTSVIIPDTVEIVGNNVFYGNNSLAKITVGSSVRYMSTDLCPGTQTTTLIFRQPAGMYVELPKAGDGTGLAYDKSSHSITIYTDNEYIKNYDWATDNVTATFYPLSQAPA